MPTYEYRCTDCGLQLEVVQSFSDDALTTCEACGGTLRKLFGNVGVVFKGSGFYRNDSRDSKKSNTATKSSAPAASTTNDSGSSSSAPASAPAPTPSSAPATPSTSSGSSSGTSGTSS